uniref:Uncharacterized protein n=1 Tax=Rhizophora mucronata TaxID=61149 RepID=A0A2P2PEF6_RHIMU
MRFLFLCFLFSGLWFG